MQPIVSIITITRNRAGLIGRCIESVQKQTYRNYEHIIVDGASNDNTEEIINYYMKSDDHIVYIKLNQYGHALQMDAGFKQSKGDFIAFLDDDDEYLPEKIEKQVNKFSTLSEDYGLVYCWMTYYDQSENNKKLYVFSHNLSGSVGAEAAAKPCVSGTPTLMVRRNVIPDVGGIYRDDIGLKGADWEFAARVCQKYLVDVVEESLVNVYVSHGFLQTTDVNYGSASLQDHIIFHEHFLKQFAPQFKEKPDAALSHYNSLQDLYYQVHDIKSLMRTSLIILKMDFNKRNIRKSSKMLVKSLIYNFFHYNDAN